ncbi:nicotinate-nucleotide--dimethylbenzimidazole phosphoribosyltransferase [Sulfobacillus harzensis]|uniref:Nicotinate-nucleotide--dimethylbenzimidazole phosphoribosyltransferase n=1 Tax=Sulfobacillus harzensis TaxID=2729629 RepID=A0A7Y0L5J5_9FIRM|nr:nicotinate-nucleotide--dimethylbenzimidazole phosphoribosyltransferase [Sulfobacillus harzensis]NMP23697.1 nicotinate-nucleotide--dimethylbenzimidazole phosphoribosyltransferase [Sulfobacillus harzensis]
MSPAFRWRTRHGEAPPLNRQAMSRAQARLDDLTKPRGSLGRLEPLIVHLAGISGHVVPRIEKPLTVIFAADHGVVEKGVSLYGPDVTEEMAVNVAMGSAVSSVLARGAGSDLWMVDVGIRRPVRHPGVRVRKVGLGTCNIAQGPAMTAEELNHALEVGWQTVCEAVDQGHDLIILGELGIGNTTAASAMAACLLGVPAADVVGPGTGIGAETLVRKTAVIDSALRVNQPDSHDARDVLRKLGGFEIAAMSGAVLAAAMQGVPVLLDGMTTGVAALAAVRMEPSTARYLIAGHCSPEPAHKLILGALDLTPLLDLSMRLGEGSGALLALPLITQALKIVAETATFTDARVTNPHHARVAEEPVQQSGGAGPVALGFTPMEKEAVYKVIWARRDIRIFLPDPVPDATLARILDAGHRGPSVGFMQPWNFVIIRDQETRRRLQALVERERVIAGQHYPDAQRDYYLRLKVEGLMDAPITLCVTNDPTRGGPHVLGRNTIPETDVMSTACAIENMWLAARAEGVAMGWVSMYRKEDVRDVLGIPEHVEPVALLTVGYTPHFPEIPVLQRVGWRQRVDLASLVYEERWGNPTHRMEE